MTQATSLWVINISHNKKQINPVHTGQGFYNNISCLLCHVIAVIR